jgi:hypothetical protein
MVSRSDDMSDEKKPSVVKLVSAPDGSISFEPYEDNEPDPQPAADGKYYLRETAKSVELALRLKDEGVEVYCGVCRAPLKVTRYFILCPTSEDHFRVVS